MAETEATIDKLARKAASDLGLQYEKALKLEWHKAGNTKLRCLRITQNDEDVYVVEGDGVERLVARYDLDNEDALQHLERRLRGLGVIRALEAAGFEPGDDVEIAGVVFELDP